VGVWLGTCRDARCCRLVHDLAVGEGWICFGDDVVSHVAGASPQGIHCRNKQPERTTLSDDERTADSLYAVDRVLGDREVLIS